MKALVFLVIHMCPKVKARESVRRHVACGETSKILLLAKYTCFVNKKIIRGTISNGFWFIKQKKFVVEMIIG